MFNRALVWIERTAGTLVTGPLGFFVAGLIDVLAAVALGLAWLWRSSPASPRKRDRVGTEPD